MSGVNDTDAANLPMSSSLQLCNCDNTSPKEPVSLNQSSVSLEDKKFLESKLLKILSCAVCLELKRSSMYQCKHGHLICAGCFGDILTESRLQNEIAVCPNCQSTISKDLCSRNVAVEKTISELPRSCPHCLQLIEPDGFKHHEEVLCGKRPVDCCYNVIGCTWKGPHNEKKNHEGECKQISATGYEILQSLRVVDQKYKEDADLYRKIYDLLSAESFSYHDLQLKQCAIDDETEDMVTHETSNFSAFDHVWVLQGVYQDEPAEFRHQLVLKSKISKPLSLDYLLVKGPFSEIDFKPKLCHFKFTDKNLESPFETLVYNTDILENVFQAKRINIRIFVFLSS